MKWLLASLLFVAITAYGEQTVQPTIGDEALIGKIEASHDEERKLFVAELNSLYELEHFKDWGSYSAQDTTIRDKVAGLSESNKRVLYDYIDSYYLMVNGHTRQRYIETILFLLLLFGVPATFVYLKREKKNESFTNNAE